MKRYAPPRFLTLNRVKIQREKIKYAPVAELADAYGSGPYFREEVQVQFLSGAPSENNPNLTPIGDGFGFVLFYEYPNFNQKKDKHKLTRQG